MSPGRNETGGKRTLGWPAGAFCPGPSADPREHSHLAGVPGGGGEPRCCHRPGCGTGCGEGGGVRIHGSPAGRRVPGDNIGAFVGTTGRLAGRAAQWNAAYSEIGPLQSDKIFYGTGTPKPLPPSFKGSVCDELKDQPVCVIAYKTASKKTVQSFVESMPPHRDRPVIMVYSDEPELGKSGMSPMTYKKNFDLRSGWVRQAAKAKGLTYVKVAMDSATYGYGRGRPGYNCSYLRAASNVDYYLADVYEHRLTTLQDQADFQRWPEARVPRAVRLGGGCSRDG
jgi:hypothetical protein